MPLRCMKTCSSPGCPTRTAAGHRFCVEHQRKQQKRYDAKRAGAAHRNYGPGWRKTRERILTRDPFCRWPGCTSRTTDVDHVIAKIKGGSDDDSNLQGLCGHHHRVKTVKEDGALRGRMSGGHTVTSI